MFSDLYLTCQKYQYYATHLRNKDKCSALLRSHVTKETAAFAFAIFVSHNVMNCLFVPSVLACSRSNTSPDISLYFRSEVM